MSDEKNDEKNDANFDETNGLAPGLEGDGGDSAAAGDDEPHGFFGRIIEGVESVFEGNAPFPTAGEAAEYGEGEGEEQRLIQERDVL